MALLLLVAATAHAQTWQFAVAGDSRDCGDVIMPAIAKSVKATPAAFYWHLGDFRKIYDFDGDMQAALAVAGKKPLNIIAYEEESWPDFIASQVEPFSPLTVYLGIGNHETIPPKTKPEWIAQFGDWLTLPNIVKQRLIDDPSDHLLKPYYHWIQNGVDFINVDNGGQDYSFDDDEMTWLTARFSYVKTHADIKTVIIGGHAALPHSLSCDHSMNQTPQGESTGTKVYKQLLDLTKAGKNVYLLASHSHFKMENTFNTPYWQNNGGVLPGWIIGTAGAVRYRLPVPHPPGSQEDVYGYYLATVAADGSVTVDFHEITRNMIPPATEKTYGASFVDGCFTGNKDMRLPHNTNCEANVPCAMP